MGVVTCASCAAPTGGGDGDGAPERPGDGALVEEAPDPGAPAQGVHADVVAIDQVYFYNRFGAFNPAGMVYALRRDVVAADPSRPIGPGNAALRPDKRPRPLTLRVNAGDDLTVTFTNWLTPAPPLPSDSTATRRASIHVNGLQIRELDALGANAGDNPSSLAEPGETRVYRLTADREGTFLIHSAAAMAGGEGDGGQTDLGLFGAIHVEPPNAVAYRSQVTAEELAAASLYPPNPDGTPRIDYDALDEDGEPILKITNDDGEIVHSDLTAIITGYTPVEPGVPSNRDQGRFREITVLFHDELKAVQAFDVLTTDPAFQGVRDGFGINYGAAGLGAELLANREKVGPSKGCTECKFEEFFLSSWANGDPAMVVEKDRGVAIRALYPDDPSNVYHAYVGDPVRMRNIHAGPKETHVFHLHSHQWLKTPNNDNSTYLDSQSIGPGGAYTYEINYGGGGNRNLTPGDAIFHCHLYPHFAQGMWALWRNHDVFEAGTPDRRLPDGEIEGGTPTPAVVPIPGLGMPSLPTYAPTAVRRADGTAERRPAMPGYPFYIAALAGHRPPQPPLDLEHDGGLQRHLVLDVPSVLPTPERFDVQFRTANLKLLPPDGTPGELAAEDFHAGLFPGAAPFTTTYGFPARAYPAFTSEGAPSRFAVNGLAAKPGAPYADPCPPGARERVYRGAYLQVDGTVNAAGWHDRQMRIEVLEQDIEATRSGYRPLEPLFIRANSGECVVYKTTNLLPTALLRDDFQIFTPTDTIGSHIHLVKFDVTSSDGSANGFNYEDATFAAEEVRARIAAANRLGGAFPADGTLAATGARVPLTATPHPAVPTAEVGSQTTVQRWWADPLLNNRGEDRTLRTAFTHDHLSPSSHQHHGLYAGLVVEPSGTTWRDPETGAIFGARADGGPTSFRADILFPRTDGRSAYREFNLAIADFAIVYDECGRPVNPPTAVEEALPVAIGHLDASRPELISAGDPGTQLINYRNEPIPLRIARRDCESGEVALKAGAAGEMHNAFRSAVHGDPYTPILKTQEGDPIQVRLIQGAQEEQHVFSINGHRWLRETSDRDSGNTNAQTVGISEHFEFNTVSQTLGAATRSDTADHLYQSTATDDLWDGLWGILRTQRRSVPGLIPLPGVRPSPLGAPGCPESAPVRRYTVHAIQAAGHLPGDRLVYNERFKLYDPDAILFVREEELEGLRTGAIAPEPLILRAAAGECVKVTLVNDLPDEVTQAPHWNYNPPIVDGFNTNQVKPSNRVSLHPQLVTYDVRRDDGADVGRNPVQTVGPREEREYSWYAGELPTPKETAWTRRPRAVEFGAINLRDMADVVTHGMHGAVGTLLIEPEGADWTDDPGTHAQSTVTYDDFYGYPRSFRELVVMYQDEIGMRSDDPRFQCGDAGLHCGTAIRNIAGEDDAEDSGHKAFNYRTEPFWARLGLRPETPPEEVNDFDLGEIFSSRRYGDPATPIFTAGASEKLRVRVVYPSGHRRQNTYALWGAEWPNNPWEVGSRSRVIGENPRTFTRGAQDGIGPMSALNIVPYYRAGGLFQVPGDRLYLNQGSFKLSDGLWGILRVTP